VNQDTLGNNPALPLYQFMMTTGTVLDNPFNVNIPQGLELAHTEGRLFYTGYDGFMEEYAPQTFDPVVTDTSGQVLLPERIIAETNRVQSTGIINTNRQPNLPIPPHLNLIDQLRAERKFAEERLKNNESYFGNSVKSVVGNDLFKAFAVRSFGTNGYQYLKGLSAISEYLSPFIYHAVSDGTDAVQAAKNVVGAVTDKVTNTASNVWNEFKNIPNTLLNLFSFGNEQPQLTGGSIKDYFKSKQHLLASHLKNRHDKVIQETDPMSIITPILQTLNILKMRKKLSDVHDTHVTQHKNKDNMEESNESAPYCGHCGSRSDLRSLIKEPIETVCGPCFVGKGITKNRKIIHEHNSEPLATSTHPKLTQLSSCYNDFVNHVNNNFEPVIEKIKPLPANNQWEHIKNTAKPFFRQDPETIINHYASHKITEPIPDDASHILKTTALLGGRLHSMMQTEIESYPKEYYNNLKHNYLWQIAHLPQGGNRPLTHNNIIRYGMGFNEIAKEYEQSRDNVRALANTFV
jgi:hypothetical protein